MNGYFNSSEFEAFKVVFGLDFFTSVQHGPSGSCWLRKFWRQLINGRNAERIFKLLSFFDCRKSRWGAYTCQSGSSQKDQLWARDHACFAETCTRVKDFPVGRTGSLIIIICLWNSPSTTLLLLKGVAWSCLEMLKLVYNLRFKCLLTEIFYSRLIWHCFNFVSLLI